MLELNGLSADYGHGPVITDINLTVGPGEAVALLGTNGSGKSTLIKAALNLVPHHGTVQLFNTPLPKFRRWNRVGYVPQRTGADSAVPATVAEVVATGLLAGAGWATWLTSGIRSLIPQARTATSQAVTEALAAVDLSDFENRNLATLSGGQQQRVLIARALVHRPDLLVLDEPTVGVDAKSQRILTEALNNVVADGATVVLVTHEMGVLTTLVTRSVVLRGGHIVYDGPVQRDLHRHHDPHHALDDVSANTDPASHLRGGA